MMQLDVASITFSPSGECSSLPNSILPGWKDFFTKFAVNTSWVTSLWHYQGCFFFFQTSEKTYTWIVCFHRQSNNPRVMKWPLCVEPFSQQLVWKRIITPRCSVFGLNSHASLLYKGKTRKLWQDGSAPDAEGFRCRCRFPIVSNHWTTVSHFRAAEETLGEIVTLECNCKWQMWHSHEAEVCLCRQVMCQRLVSNDLTLLSRKVKIEGEHVCIYTYIHIYVSIYKYTHLI